VNDHLFFPICYLLLAIAQAIVAVRRKQRVWLFFAAAQLLFAIASFLRK
jgi:hypothetical protein